MVSKIRDWLLKANPRYATALLIVSACLLFMPQNVLFLVHANRFAESYRLWIYMLFFTSAAILLMYPVHKIWGHAVGLLGDRKAIKYVENRLHSLTTGEKAVLHVYVSKNQRVAWFHNSETVSGLVADKILRLTPVEGIWSEGSPYNVTDWAWQYLQKHPQVVDPGVEESLPDIRKLP